MLAGDQLGQIAPLLRVVAVAGDLVDAEIGMRAIGEADRGRGARNLLHRDAMFEIAKAKPAIFLRRGDPVQAERAHLRPEVAREKIVAIDLRARAARFPCRRNGASYSRIMSALSPRSKLKGAALFRSMGGTRGSRRRERIYA